MAKNAIHACAVRPGENRIREFRLARAGRAGLIRQSGFTSFKPGNEDKAKQ